MLSLYSDFHITHQFGYKLKRCLIPSRKKFLPFVVDYSCTPLRYYLTDLFLHTLWPLRTISIHLKTCVNNFHCISICLCFLVFESDIFNSLQEVLVTRVLSTDIFVIVLLGIIYQDFFQIAFKCHKFVFQNNILLLLSLELGL